MSQKQKNSKVEKLLHIVKRYAGTKITRRFISEQVKTRHRFISNLSKPALNGKPEQQDLFRRLVEICRSGLQQHEFQEVMLDMGTLFESYADHERAEQAYSIIVEQKEQSMRDEYRAEAYFRRGKLFSDLGQWDKAVHDLEKSRALFSIVHDELAIAGIDNVIGTTFAERGRFKEAEQYFSKALEKTNSIDDTTFMGDVYMNMGMVQNILGNWEEALHYYNHALLHLHAGADLVRISELHADKGSCFNAMGNYSAAIYEFDEALAIARKLNNNDLREVSLLGKAYSYHHMNDNTFALVLCNQIEDLHGAAVPKSRLGELYRLKGMISREKLEYDIAENYIRLSIDFYERNDHPLHLGEGYYELGLLHRCCRRAEESQRSFRLALKQFTRAGAHEEIERTKKAATGTVTMAGRNVPYA